MKTYIAIIISTILEAINGYQMLEMIFEHFNLNPVWTYNFEQMLMDYIVMGIIGIPVFMIVMVKVWNFVIDDVMRQLEEEDEA